MWFFKTFNCLCISSSYVLIQQAGLEQFMCTSGASPLGKSSRLVIPWAYPNHFNTHQSTRLIPYTTIFTHCLDLFLREHKSELWRWPTFELAHLYQCKMILVFFTTFSYLSQNLSLDALDLILRWIPWNVCPPELVLLTDTIVLKLCYVTFWTHLRDCEHSLFGNEEVAESLKNWLFHPQCFCSSPL